MKVKECTEIVSVWTRCGDRVVIKIAEDCSQFRCEYWRENDEQPFSCLRFCGTPNTTTADIRANIERIENFLFDSHFDGFFYNSEHLYI